MTRAESAAIQLASTVSHALEKRLPDLTVMCHGPHIEVVHYDVGRVACRCMPRLPEHAIEGVPLSAHRAYLIVRTPWLKWSGNSRFDARRWWRSGRYQPCFGVIASVVRSELSVMQAAGCDGLPPSYGRSSRSYSRR